MTSVREEAYRIQGELLAILESGEFGVEPGLEPSSS
jgi:hypothetical protein